jgi:hypothetical protein
MPTVPPDLHDFPPCRHYGRTSVLFLANHRRSTVTEAMSIGERKLRSENRRFGGRLRTFVATMILAAGLTGHLMGAPTDPLNPRHIRIVKQSLYEQDAGIGANAIVGTRDHGYVIAGAGGWLIGPAWAMRVGAMGEVVWRYTLPLSDRPNMTKTAYYTGVAQMPDDSTVLCGTVNIRPEASKVPVQVGILTRLSHKGDVISQDFIDPDDTYTDNDIAFCGQLRDGLYVVASGIPPAVIRPTRASDVRVLTYDSRGKRVTDKGFLPDGVLTQVVSHGGNVFFLFDIPPIDNRSPFATKILEMDDTQQIRAIRRLSGNALLLHREKPSAATSVLAYTSEGWEVRALDRHLEDKHVSPLAYRGLFKSWAFQLSNDSMVLFGSADVQKGMTSDSVTWISPDLEANEVFIYQPLFAGGYPRDPVTWGSRPDEFVIARNVHPAATRDGLTGPNGIMLVQIQVR